MSGHNGLSITQPASDDAGGEMMRRIITLLDEHQNRENSRRTGSRALKENVRQGFSNGSHAPFGYLAVTTDISGPPWPQKKDLRLTTPKPESFA